MIRVEIKYKEDCISSIEISGHAYQNKEGFDLVCAGVSATYSGAVYSLEGKGIKETHSKGYAKIDVVSDISTHDHYVLEVLKDQLVFLGREEKDYIKVTLN